MNKKEMEERLINFAVLIIEIANELLLPSNEKMQLASKENDELISIFVRSVETAQKNLKS